MEKIPSVDVFIGLFFAVGCAYTVLLRREKAIATLAATYISLVVTNNFGQTIYEFFNGNKVLAGQIWVRSNASLTTVMIGTFLLGIIFFGGAISSSVHKSDSTAIEVTIISALTIALILSSVLTFMTPEMRDGFIATSKVVASIVKFGPAWAIVPPFALIALRITRK